MHTFACFCLLRPNRWNYHVQGCSLKQKKDRFRMNPNSSPWMLQTFNPERAGRYQQDGYLVVDSAITSERLDRLREESTAAWHRSKQAFDANSTWLRNALLPDVHHHSQAVRDYYFEGPLVDLAERLIGPNIKAATAQLTFKLRGNTQSFGWHQDNGYGELDPYNAVSTLTALDDASVENGCLWLIPGSHRQGQLQRRPDMPDIDREIRMEVDETSAIPVPLKAGQALVMHCWMLHRSGPNLSGIDRRILFMRYADADAVEVYHARRPRLGRILRGKSRFAEVEAFEANL
jgi:hypothetical protein